MSREFAPYRGEFRFVFYTGDDLYKATLTFYAQSLGLPVIGGFGEWDGQGYSDGTYYGVSAGVIEVICGGGADDLRPILTGTVEPYAAPRGGFLLVEVPDVDALAASVERSGVAFFKKRVIGHGYFATLKVRDPCGNIVCCFSRLPGWEALHGETAP